MQLLKDDHCKRWVRDCVVLRRANGVLRLQLARRYFDPELGNLHEAIMHACTCLVEFGNMEQHQLILATVTDVLAAFVATGMYALRSPLHVRLCHPLSCPVL